jgi:Predicted membrane protein
VCSLISTLKLLKKAINRRPLLVFIIIEILLIAVIFKDYVLLHKLPLFTDIGDDSITTFYPWFANMATALSRANTPAWSFSIGMGYPFNVFIANFLDLPIFLFGKGAVAYVLIYVFILKLFLTGLCFYWYLSIIGLSKAVRIIGSVLVSFCSYMLLGLSWLGMPYDVLYAVLLLVSLELGIAKKQWWFLSISVFLLVIYSLVCLQCFIIFSFIYLVIRHYEGQSIFNRSDIVKSVTYSLIGVLASFFFSCYALQIAFNSPRGSTNASHVNSLMQQSVFTTGHMVDYVTAVYRSFSSDILGSAINYSGCRNYYEAPIIYCGLIVLLLVPLVIFHTRDTKKRIVYLCPVFLLIISVVLPYARYAFWLFLGDYFRTLSLITSVLLVYIALRGLDALWKGTRFSRPIVLIVTLFMLAMLFFPYPLHGIILHRQILLTTKLFLATYGALLFLLTMPRFSYYIKFLIFGMVLLETMIFSWITVNEREAISRKKWESNWGFNDRTNDALLYLKSIDSSFYRIHKTYSSTPTCSIGWNDAMAQGFFSTSCYLSFNQVNYIRFLALLDIVDLHDESSTRWSHGIEDRPILRALTSERYWLTKNNRQLLPDGCRLIDTIGGIAVLRDDYSLPLGFCYDTVMSENDFEKLNKTQKEVALLHCVVLPDSATILNRFARLMPGELALKSTINHHNSIVLLKQDTLSLISFREDWIRGNLRVDKPKILFMSIPFDRGWSLSIDKKQCAVQCADGGMIGAFIPEGKHSVELRYRHPYFIASAIISSAGLLLYFIVFWIDCIIRRNQPV